MKPFNKLSIQTFWFVLYFLGGGLGLSLSSLCAQDQKNSGRDSTSSNSLEEVVLLGTRGSARLTTQSAVPVDVISMKDISSNAPQVSMNALLNYTVPSFTSTPQTIADGSDHIDPANLRGFGPDATLVLINGKRRHTTSLVNVNGTMGRGSVGTDLNAIPSMAIDKLEVLRDGASAQYGSDAIAGVINLGLRKNSKGTQIRVTTGMNPTTYQAYTEQGKGNYANDLNPQYVNRSVVDGAKVQVGINQGFSLGKKERGFLNVTGMFDARDYTNRSGERTGDIVSGTIRSKIGASSNQDYLDNIAHKTREDYRMRVGQSTMVGGQLFANFGYKLHEKSEMELYAFGGASYRYGTSAGFYRLPYDARNIVGVFPHGYLPIITSKLLDVSLATGLRGMVFDKKWHYDVSVTVGRNSFDFGTKNLVNASTKNPANYTIAGGADGLDSTKTNFYAGQLAFLQITSNIDLSRHFDVLEGLNVAFGGEYRHETYTQTAGETASWANYNGRTRSIAGTESIDPTGKDAVKSYMEDGKTDYPNGGSNVFPGLRPENATTASRFSFAGYVDVEQHFAKWLMLDVAGRFENYSDFGSNFSGKVAARVNPFRWLALRGSFSTGFRAPSLQQRFLNKTSSVFVGGQPTLQATFTNESSIAQQLGIPSSKPEISMSYSAGLTLSFKKIKFSLDAYSTHISDRIIYTGTFQSKELPSIKRILDEAGASSALFFVNGLTTQNRGIDMVLSYVKHLPMGHLRLDLSGTISEVIIGDLQTSKSLDSLRHIYLGSINKNLMTESFPRTKFNVLLNYGYKKWGLFLRGSYVGAVTQVEGGSYTGKYVVAPGDTAKSFFFRQELSPLFVVDMSVSFLITPKIKLTAGVNNLFDIYPDIISASKGRFFVLQRDPKKANYNTIVADQLTAKQVEINNDDVLTSNNQMLYSRRVSQIGLNGRSVFLRVEINL